MRPLWCTSQHYGIAENSHHLGFLMRSWDDRGQNTWASNILAPRGRLDRCELKTTATKLTMSQPRHRWVLYWDIDLEYQKQFLSFSLDMRWLKSKSSAFFFRITIASLHGSRIQRAIKAFTSWNSDWIVSKSLTRHFSKSHDPWKKHWSHYVM